MSSFSPTDAALEGVRLSRERPRAILIWSGCYLAFTLLLTSEAFLTLGPNCMQILSELQQPTQNTEDFAKLLQQAWPFLALAFPTALVFQAMFTGAVYRAILGAGVRTQPYLKFGADELRLLALKVVMAAIWTGLLFVGLLTVQTAGIGASQVAGLLGYIVDLGLIWAGVLIWVRLSLAGPATFVEHRLTIFKTWPLTHGQFWRLFGAYLLACAIAAVIFILMAVLGGAGLELTSNLIGAPLDKANLLTSEPKLFVIALISQAITSLLCTCGYVNVLSPSAQAYHDLMVKR
ncbi:MAG: hypothetical protein JO303_15935 [Caulobacteraceae bacterium]|nr:hypothetical protein [Caulobacteraceae bacterium]